MQIIPTCISTSETHDKTGRHGLTTTHVTNTNFIRKQSQKWLF